MSVFIIFFLFLELIFDIIYTHRQSKKIFVIKPLYLIKNHLLKMLKKIISTGLSGIDNRSKIQSPKKLSLIAIMISLMLVAILISTIPVHSAYAQNTNTNTLGEVTNLTINGKNYPIKYNITTGKLLGLVEDKDKTTLIAILSTLSDKGTLNIEIPRNILDDKGQSNADAKYTVHVDGKDATFRETSNNKTARTLSIDFNKDARMIEIIGTQATQPQ
jgi:hypothetical protein